MTTTQLITMAAALVSIVALTLLCLIVRRDDK
jgi:hypothetical protein